jgi:RimJ/RimL family protein N-acetyltransferase
MPWDELLPEGIGLEFQILRPEHYDGLFSVASDPLLWEQHPDRFRYTKAGFDSFFKKALENDCQTLVVVNAGNGQIMGSSRYYNFKADENSVFIGFTFLAREYWGGLWNRRLKYAMLRHALAFCSSVLFEAASDNHRSIAALEKLGAKRISHPDFKKCLFLITRESWPEIENQLRVSIQNELKS